jgi:V/A-type H+-transporting ATPase subunit C
MMKTAKKVRPEDFLYASARARKLETRLSGREGSYRLCDARDAEEVRRGISDYAQGFGVAAELPPDEALDAILGQTYRDIAEMSGASGNEKVFDVFRYPYDCHNIKYALKCFIRGRTLENTLAGMYDFATVSPLAVYEAIQSEDYSALPKHMAKAAETSRAEYSRLRDPKLIDIALDRALYADMLELAGESGVDAFAEAVRLKIDLTNILTALRILRMNAGGRLLNDALIDGGTLKTERFAGLSSEEELWESLRKTEFRSIRDACGDDLSFDSVERAADDYYLSLLSKTKYLAYGPEIPAAYLSFVEYEAKNLRIIYAGKNGGVDSRELRRRLRAWWQ